MYGSIADGEARIKPLLIFRGKGLRISLREKVCVSLRLPLCFKCGLFNS